MSVQRTNRFWYVSLKYTLFLDLLKLFENMHFTVSFAGRKKTHFLDLQIKSYGCLKFQGEVQAGRAYARANEKELTTCAKFWKQEVGERGQGEHKKGDPCRSGQRPLVAPNQVTVEQSTVSRSTTAGRLRPLAAAQIDQHRGISYIFLDSFFIKKLRPLHVARPWASEEGGGLGVQHPNF